MKTIASAIMGGARKLPGPIFVSELDTRCKIFANTWVASSIKDFLDLIQDVIDDFTVDMEIICSIL